MKKAYRDGWFKVSRRLIESSLWSADPLVLKVWLALLEGAQQPGCLKRGTVIISRPILAGRCLITPEQLDAALAVLAGPDVESRTPDHDGRRIEVLPNGFRVLNYGAYHDSKTEAKLSDARRAAGRRGGEKSADARKAKRNQQVTTQQNASKPEANRKQTATRQRQRQRQETENNGTSSASGGSSPVPVELVLVPDTTPGKAKSWSQEAADDWIAVYGGPPLGRYFKALEPIVKRETWAVVRPVLRYYLTETPAEYVDMAKFGSTFGAWRRRWETGVGRGQEGLLAGTVAFLGERQ